MGDFEPEFILSFDLVPGTIEVYLIYFLGIL